MTCKNAAALLAAPFFAALFAWYGAVPAPAAAETAALTPEQRAELKKATRTLLCSCGDCPPTLIDECICHAARKIKDTMTDDLLSGKSAEEIAEAYVAEYGEKYLAAPPWRGFYALLWLLPAIAFAGITAAFWAALKRVQRRAKDESERPDAPKPLSEAERRRIETELNERRNAHGS